MVSVNWDIVNNTRTPSDPDYFMLVNQDWAGDQYASSVAGENNAIAGSNGDVFYSFASGGPDEIDYKVSNVTQQPWLRKKFEETQESFDVQIFPNPTKGKVSLDFSSMDSDELLNISVYSMEGKKVYYNSCILKNAPKELDLNKFGSGIYFIELKSDNYLINKKIIVE